MVNRPEDQPKVILLSVAIVVVFVYFGVAVLPRILHSGPDHGISSSLLANAQDVHPHAPAGAMVTQSGSSMLAFPSTIVASAASHGAITTSGVGVESPSTRTRDPFAPLTVDFRGIAGSIGGVSQHPTPSTQQPNMQAQTVQSRHPAPSVGPVQPKSLSTLPPTNLISRPLAGTGTAPDLPAAIAARSTATTTGSAAPSLSLDGVILTGSAVAILRLGDQTLEEHVGDRLPGDLVVARITDNGIVLKRGKQSLPLMQVGDTIQISILSDGRSTSAVEISSPNYVETESLSPRQNEPSAPKPDSSRVVERIALRAPLPTPQVEALVVPDFTGDLPQPRVRRFHRRAFRHFVRRHRQHHLHWNRTRHRTRRLLFVRRLRQF